VNRCDKSGQGGYFVIKEVIQGTRDRGRRRDRKSKKQKRGSVGKEALPAKKTLGGYEETLEVCHGRLAQAAKKKIGASCWKMATNLGGQGGGVDLGGYDTFMQKLLRKRGG